MRKHPETGAKVDELYKRVSDNDRDAYAFLCVFDDFINDVVRFVHTHNDDRDDFVALLARNNTTFSLPFYIRNGHFLWQPIQEMWDDFAQNPEESASVLLVGPIMAVANLKLGFVDARKLSSEIREVAVASRLANSSGKG